MVLPSYPTHYATRMTKVGQTNTILFQEKYASSYLLNAHGSLRSNVTGMCTPLSSIPTVSVSHVLQISLPSLSDVAIKSNMMISQ